MLAECKCVPGQLCMEMPNRHRKILQAKRWDAFALPYDLTPDESTQLAGQTDAAIVAEFGAGHEHGWCQSMQPVVTNRGAV